MRESWLIAVCLTLTGAGAAFAQPLDLVSRIDPARISDTGNDFSFVVSSPPAGERVMSADGRYVVFQSRAENLIPGGTDTNATLDVFLYDRATGTTTLVSHAASSAVTAADQGSDRPSLSADGRYVMFQSNAGNLVPGQSDTLGYPSTDTDVFLYDRLSGTTTLVSHAEGQPTRGTGRSFQAVLSADGRYVAYASASPELVAGTGAGSNIFLYDRTTGVNFLVSRRTGATTPGGTDSSGPTISADGRYVAYSSMAANLVPGQTDTNSQSDVFLFDRESGATTLVSRISDSPTTTGSSYSLAPAISGDGRFVAFVSAVTNLVAGHVDINNESDVFLFDRTLGSMVLVSHAASSATAAGNRKSEWGAPAISDDGNWIAYTSAATNLVAGQVNDNLGFHLFLYDRASGTNVLVDHASSSPAATAYGFLDGRPSLSADGRFLAFTSDARNLVAGADHPGYERNVFLYDRLTAAVSLISHLAGSPGTAGSAASSGAAVSADGAFVAFASDDSGLAAGSMDTNFASDAFVHERATGANRIVSLRAADQPSVTPPGDSLVAAPQASSADGRFVPFSSAALFLVPGVVDDNGTTDLFLRDRLAGTTTLVSHRAGAPLSAAGFSGNAAISADGRWIAYLSAAPDLVPGQNGPAGYVSQVFLWDRRSGVTVLVSHAPASSTAGASRNSTDLRISADGRWIAFLSEASDLVAGQVDDPYSPDLFLYDRESGAVTLASHVSGSPATAGSVNSWDGFSLSADGRYLAFSSYAGNLAAGISDERFYSDVFLYDRVTGETSLVSRSTGNSQAAADGESSGPSLSADGRFIGFSSSAGDLIPGQVADYRSNVFLQDRETGETLLVSHQLSSRQRGGNGGSSGIQLSEDGRYAVYLSEANDLVSPGDTGNTRDVFLFDRLTGASTLVSRASGSALPANGPSFDVSFNASGRFVAFNSYATNLVPGQTDTPFSVDLFVYDRIGGAAALVNRAGGSPTTPAVAQYGEQKPLSSGDGCAVLLLSSDRRLVPNDRNGQVDVFVDPRLPFGADLAVAHTGGARAIPGQTLTFTVTARNHGPCATTDAVVSDDFPAALQGVSWTCAPSPGSVCTPAGAGDLADTVTLLPGGSAVYTVTGTVAPGATGTLTHIARVATVAGVPDPQAANDEATDTDVVSAQPLGALSTLPPCRLLDTRLAADGPALVSGVTETLTVAGRCGVPPTATAIAVNVTVTQPTGSGHLVFHAGGQPPGLTSTINFGAGQTRANNAILTLAANGDGTLAVTPAVSGNGTVHVIVDVSGFFE